MCRPTLLITDAYPALTHSVKRGELDDALIANIVLTLRRNANVLVLSDTAGRLAVLWAMPGCDGRSVLELLQVLHVNWAKKEKGLLAYKLVLLNPLCDSILTFAKTNVRSCTAAPPLSCAARVHAQGDARGV